MIKLTPALALAASIVVVLSSCKDSPKPTDGSTPAASAARPSAQLQKALGVAVADSNLDSIVALLKQGAQPDQPIEGDRDALAIAGELCKQHRGKESIWPLMRVFSVLRKHVRLRDAKSLSLQGTFELALVQSAKQGSHYVELSVKLPDGTKYPAAISATETTYVNTSVDDQKFVVRFDQQYRFQGTLQKGTFEIDEVTLIAADSILQSASASQGARTGGAMAIPVPLFLPSTGEALTPYLS